MEDNVDKHLNAENLHLKHDLCLLNSYQGDTQNIK